MNGDSHRFVANIALACLDIKQRHILYPRWGGIEAGATLSDDFRIMWEPESADAKTRQLVHRYYVDSKDPQDHGCVTRALDHAEGTIGFITEHQEGTLDGYTEEQFLENMGMFLGILCHHVADLCSPVHVGHKIDFRALGHGSLKKFHNVVERDIDRRRSNARIQLVRPKRVAISKRYLRGIADETYQEYFTRLHDLYESGNEAGLDRMASGALSSAVKHTACLWHTILARTKMTEREWSQQPLL